MFARRARRLSDQTRLVLAVFQAEPETEVSGFDIIRKTKLWSGTLYPILARLESRGWLSSAWEELESKHAARPRRRLYKITELGAAEAATA